MPLDHAFFIYDMIGWFRRWPAGLRVDIAAAFMFHVHAAGAYEHFTSFSRSLPEVRASRCRSLHGGHWLAHTRFGSASGYGMGYCFRRLSIRYRII